MAQLLITLRFYALGSMLLSVGDFSGVSKSSVSNIVQKVSSAIALLRKDFIKMPQTDEELHEASKSFYDMNKFPKTIGAIDCTHVKIQSPGNNYDYKKRTYFAFTCPTFYCSSGGANAEYFRNRKGIFSLNVQTVGSADLKVMNVVARWPGSCHDQTIFNNSKLKMQLENNFYKGYILIADSGYANTSYMATPLLECHNPVEQLYNECIIRTRNVVERLFGVWKRRFPVLSLGMRLKMETVQDIVVATAVLHNIAVDLNDGVPPTLHEDMENVLANESFELNRIEDDRFENVRSKLLSNYFPALLRENEA